MLDLVAERCETTATTLAASLPVSRVAVVKHLRILEGAGLVMGRRAGREVLYRVRPEALSAAARRMSEQAAEWDARLAALRRLAEG